MDFLAMIIAIGGETQTKPFVQESNIDKTLMILKYIKTLMPTCERKEGPQYTLHLVYVIKTCIFLIMVYASRC